MHVFTGNIFGIVSVFWDIYGSGYHYLHRRSFIRFTIHLYSGLAYQYFSRFLGRKKIGIGLGKTAFAIDPGIADRLVGAAYYSKILKTWGSKIVSVLVHFKIHPQSFIYTKTIFTHLCIKLNLRRYGKAAKQKSQ